jgi:hypothetical protein
MHAWIDPHPDFRVLESQEVGWMDGWMILIRILGFWSSERLDGWRILIWILGFRSPERLDGWRILVRILGFWSPRDRDDEEDLNKSSVVGEREGERCRALVAQHCFAMFSCFSRLQYLLCICVIRKKTFKDRRIALRCCDC